MKTVVAVVGSGRKKNTFQATRRFLDNLQALGGVETEILALSDHHIGTCLGCSLCFTQGEAFCPLKDDRDALLEKLMRADGVVFSTPCYLFHVSGLMKTFIDRLGFVGHRPRFFGKTFTSIVTQGLPFDTKIVKYLDFVASCLGFHSVKGIRLMIRDPMPEKASRRNEKKLRRQAQRFHRRLMSTKVPAPSWVMLVGFRVGRATMRVELTDASPDYRYYKDKGWFESDYYYPVRLGLLKKLGGAVFDVIGAAMSRTRAA